MIFSLLDDFYIKIPLRFPIMQIAAGHITSDRFTADE
jgi:hypothetical protein